jgi:crossover junction endodeoxyribonuclease RuvC
VNYVIGIDPGINGAIAIFENGQLDAVIDMPTLEMDSGKTKKRHISAIGLVRILETWTLVSDGQAHVVIEKVGAMPGQGVSSMFNFGRSAGIIEGVVAALRMPHTYVTPATWTKAVGRSVGKDASRMRAMELFPNKAELFKRAKDDGRADAALIAYWYITKNA